MDLESVRQNMCVAAMPAVKSVTATWSSSGELIENNIIIKNSTRNVHAVNI
jgi:hypothetical protein